jgi:hypothetical protein
MDYNKKYLKYKIKYLELKKLYGGDPLEDKSVGEKILHFEDIPQDIINKIKENHKDLRIDSELRKFIIDNKRFEPDIIIRLVSILLSLKDKDKKVKFKTLLNKNIDFVYAEKLANTEFTIEEIEKYINTGIAINFIETALKFSPEQKALFFKLLEEVPPILAYHIVKNNKNSEQIKEVFKTNGMKTALQLAR